MFPKPRPFAKRTLVLCLSLLIVAIATAVLAAPASTFVPAGTLSSSDGTEDDQFGLAVAIDDDTAVVGAPGWAKDDQNYFGSVYVYTHTAAGWTERTQIIHDDGHRSDIFGASVALDGETLAVGAIYRDRTVPNTIYDAGAVIVYTGAADSWVKQATLMPDDLVSDNTFGNSLSLDDETLIVGAPNYSSTDNEAAYIYRRSGAAWSLEDKLSVAGSPADFGAAVAVVDDVALVGAPGPTQDSGASPLTPGIVYLFIRSGTDWLPAGTLIPAESESGDNFGCAIDYDGQTAVIGACEAYGTTPDPGKAYVFVRDGANWSQQARLTPMVDNFPLEVSSVALEGDQLVLGASNAQAVGQPGTNPGAAFVYERTGSDWSWTQTLYAADGQSGDAYGSAVAMDGDALLVGSPYDDILNIAEQGSVYAYRSAPDIDYDYHAYMPAVIGEPANAGAN